MVYIFCINTVKPMYLYSSYTSSAWSFQTSGMFVDNLSIKLGNAIISRYARAGDYLTITDMCLVLHDNNFLEDGIVHLTHLHFLLVVVDLPCNLDMYCTPLARFLKKFIERNYSQLPGFN